MFNSVTLVTDKGSIEYIRSLYDDNIINFAFDKIVEVDNSRFRKQAVLKRFKDTRYEVKKLPWINQDRITAYDLSPYEETILMDADYFVLNNALDGVWGSVNSMMMNKDAFHLDMQPLPMEEQRLHWSSIPMYWATVVYFKKDDFSRAFFDLVSFVKDNWEYFSQVYNFRSGVYRNDYAFSVAAHWLNDFREQPSLINPLPIPYIYTSPDTDELIDVKDCKSLYFLEEKRGTPNHFILNRVRSNVHVMNKFSIVRNIQKIIEACYGNNMAR